MSSHPPMGSPALVLPPNSRVICGYTGGRIEDAHKLTVDWSIRKHIRHMSSVRHRGHLSHPRPQAPRASYTERRSEIRRIRGMCRRYAHNV
jgi:hypothetical protein